jgi:hypothetical protein
MREHRTSSLAMAIDATVSVSTAGMNSRETDGFAASWECGASTLTEVATMAAAD